MKALSPKQITLTNVETNLQVNIESELLPDIIKKSINSSKGYFVVKDIIKACLEIVKPIGGSNLYVLQQSLWLIPDGDCNYNSPKTLKEHYSKMSALSELCELFPFLRFIVFGTEGERISYHSDKQMPFEVYILEGCWLVGNEWKPCSDHDWENGDGNLREYVFYAREPDHVALNSFVGSIPSNDWQPREYDRKSENREWKETPYTRICPTDHNNNCLTTE